MKKHKRHQANDRSEQKEMGKGVLESDRDYMVPSGAYEVRQGCEYVECPRGD